MIISISGYAGSGKDAVASMMQHLTAKDSGRNCYQRLLQGESIAGYHNSEWGIKKWADPLRKVAAILLDMDIDFLYTDEFKQMELPECWGEWRIKCINGLSEGVYLITYKKFKNKQEAQFYRDKLIDYQNYIIEFIPMIGRQFLQKLGTDAMRDNVHINCWVNSLMGQYKGWTEKMWTPADGYGEGYSHAACKECGNKFTGWKRQSRCQNCNEKTPLIYPKWIVSDTRFPNEIEAVKNVSGITLKINRPCKECNALEGHKTDCSVGSKLHSSETSLNSTTFDYKIDNTGTLEELLPKVETFLKRYSII